MSRRRAAGFTLIEMVLAVGLSSIVLIGIFSMMTSMVQQQVEAGRKGSVTAWSLASINTMNTAIAGSSCLVAPALGGSGDSLVLCSNWSRRAVQGNPNGGKVASGSDNIVYSFCYDPADGVIRGMSAVGACPNLGAAPPSCSAASYGVGNVVATGVYRNAGVPVFLSDSTTPGAIRLRYVVGNPNQGTVSAGNAGTSFVNPQFIAFDTKVLIESFTSGN